MKDFIRDIKDGLKELPNFLVFSICVFGIAYLFGDIEFAVNCFFVFMGIWVVIFVAFPSIILILDVINKVLSNKKESK